MNTSVTEDIFECRPRLANETIPQDLIGWHCLGMYRLTQMWLSLPLLIFHIIPVICFRAPDQPPMRRLHFISRLGYPRWRYFYIMIYLTVWGEFLGFIYIECSTCTMTYIAYWVFIIFQYFVFVSSFVIIFQILKFAWLNYEEEKDIFYEIEAGRRNVRNRSLWGG